MNSAKIFMRFALVCAAAALLMAMPQNSCAQVVIGVAVAVVPPELPVYDQPLCPGDDYYWVPGYWAWDNDFDDYYWVPGTWVLAPEPGFFWTPGYWAWVNDAYYFQPGYWGPVVGFYGGIDYGFGYFGNGFVGGRWDRGRFFYNTAVTNVNVTVIHNTYVDRTVIVNRTEVPRVSYNGGRGGINARPTPQQEAAARERHSGPIDAQTRNRDAARSNREFRASVNHGRPPIAATPRPAAFNDRGIVPAREGGAVHTREETRSGANPRPQNNGRPATHPNELPPPERMPAPHTGNAKQDEKYEKQQEKMEAQQAKERQKLQQQQDKEHAKEERQRASEQRQQQMEQLHQQQTQQMQQRQEQQRQTQQRREEPSARPPASRPPERPPHE
jgi:WXXGXW repeat (2 copies)